MVGVVGQPQDVPMLHFEFGHGFGGGPESGTSTAGIFACHVEQAVR
jgi:hypothetical protein